MYPSVKTLREIAGDRAKELRKVLEIVKRSEIEALLDLDPETGKCSERGVFKYPVTRKWYNSCFHPMSLGTAKMSIADEILGTHGVEHIPAGHNSKSPAIDYCNTGDTYGTTLLRIFGRGAHPSYRVGCWGDIVERGNYD